MNPLAIGGFLMAVAGAIYVVIAAGSSPAALWDTSSFVLVFGGTVGATMLSLPGEDVVTALKLFGRIFNKAEANYSELIALFVELADQARRDGLLSLEERINQLNHPFIEKGLQLLVDGTDPGLVREMLEMDVNQLASRHARRYGVFETLGGFSPTMGMLGTVMGIIFTLANLTTPEEIGAKIALAFITTMYGVILANFLFLPVAARLKRMSQLEVSEWELSLVGLLAVQAGDNPQIVKQKLEAFLPVRARNVEPDEAP